ncbi:MAG: hypothetical protein KA717_08730 [Woronichinia naegeliana WA131]|jgi:hypothetical protein|uniref:vWA-MoxR associated protein N-terminal HTH domain-containing protein n=1 Tax=Woronichinia naegeliana WA131 TaxID=2824559 RepID=A0A977KZJ2_9CYAN|nr:MAG: hypothetical protein KA717_08730 [Woronichinia naegeliana WA131]
MNNQQIINHLDQITYKKTGKHFNDLQFTILEGVLNGDKYSDIAKRANCTKGNINDKASELWQLLTKTFGERINKTNLKTTIQRHMEKSNLCHSILMDEDIVAIIEKTIESVQMRTKLSIGSRLQQVGLSGEQIARVLDLPLKSLLGFLNNLENLDDLPD